MTNQIKAGQIVENKLSNGSVIVCRVVEIISIAGETMYRLTDARETRQDAWLIKNNRTWAAPIANVMQGASPMQHKSGLVVLG